MAEASTLGATHPSILRAIEEIKRAVERPLVRDAILLGKRNNVGLRITLKVSKTGEVRVGVSLEDPNGSG